MYGRVCPGVSDAYVRFSANSPKCSAAVRLSGVSKGKAYPLGALQEKRKSEVDERARALARERARTEVAKTRAVSAELALDRHDQATNDELESERAQLEAGALRVQDLAQVAGWEHAAAEQRVALERQRSEAAQALAAQRAAEGTSQAELVRADADAEAVAKHRNGWEAARRKAQQDAEAEAAEEAWLARRSDTDRSDP